MLHGMYMQSMHACCVWGLEFGDDGWWVRLCCTQVLAAFSERRASQGRTVPPMSKRVSTASTYVTHTHTHTRTHTDSHTECMSACTCMQLCILVNACAIMHDVQKGPCHVHWQGPDTHASVTVSCPCVLSQLLDSLPVIELDSERLASMDADTRCPICTDALQTGDKVFSLPCRGKHWFHPACVRPWLQKTNSCPVCRDVSCLLPTQHSCTA